MLLDTAVVLGPARVLEVVDARVRLATADRERWATLATPYPYRPARGDVALTITQGEEGYVIGVIEGKGKTTFTAPGNVDIRAPHGMIALESSKGIRLRAGSLDFQARDLKMVAETCTENYGEAYRWVHGAFQFRAESVRQAVSGKYSVVAGRIVECAKKDVVIDGEKINLG